MKHTELKLIPVVGHFWRNKKTGELVKVVQVMVQKSAGNLIKLEEWMLDYDPTNTMTRSEAEEKFGIIIKG